MATPAIDILRTLRRKLASMRRQLAEVRESMNNIIECDDNAQVLESLENKEHELVREIAKVTTELQTAEYELDRSMTPSPVKNPAVFHSIESIVHHLSLDEESEAAASSPPTTRAPMIAANTTFSKPANPAAVLGKIALPELRELCQLKDHILRFELVLREANLGTQDPEKGFLLLPEICFSTCLRFCRSISKCPSVEKFAEDMMLYDADWTSLKSKLLERYCSPTNLLEAYQRKLAALKFVGMFDCFMDDIRDAWRIGRVACSNPALEQRLIIHKIREVIPYQIYHDTLNRLNVIHIDEWEYRITFDSDDEKSFLGALKVSWKLAQLTKPLRPAVPALTTPPGAHGTYATAKPKVPGERVARVSPTGAFDKKNFKSILVTAMALNVSSDSLKRAEELVKNMPQDKYRAYTSKRSRGYLIGCKSDEEHRELDAAFSIIPGCKPRRFTDDRENDSQRAAAVADDSQPPPADYIGKVSRQKAPSEHVIDGDLFAVHENESHMKLKPRPTLQLDSGAGLCYLTATQGMRDSLVASDLLRPVDPFSVILADGSTTSVNSFVLTQLHVYPANGIRVATDIRELRMYLLPGTTDPPHVLLGRCAIDSFDFVISKDGVRCGDVWVCDVGPQVRDRVSFAQSNRSLNADIERSLKKVVERGWTPLLRSPEYSMRLCELPAEAPRDHPDQTHAIMVKIPETTERFDQSDKWISEVQSRARGMYRRLNSGHRETQAEIISSYLERGWWKEATVEACRVASRFAPVASFLATGSNKPRIVVNFVPVNQLLPASSTPSTMPAHLVAALRMARPDCILVCDAASAFYKLRLERDFLWIMAAQEENGQIRMRHFLSDRVVFGISCGPSSLITSMQELFFDKSSCGISAFAGWYVDDNALAGSVTEVVRSLKATSSILNRVGHELQVSKCFAICRESKRNELEAALADLGPVQVSDSAEIFNATMQYCGDEFLDICCNDPMRRVVLSRLSDFDVARSRLTKADFFKLAGVLSYDLIKCHVEEKCIADSLRSLIGREFAADGWHAPLALSQLTPQKKQCLDILVDWSRDLLERNEEACRHRVKLPGRYETATPELNLFVDASISGGGFAITVGNDSIWADAWRWCDSQLRWHINSQELTAILRGIRTVSDVVHCFTSCRPGSSVRINVFSDNKSAVKWSTLKSGDILARHQSRRTLMRMVDELADEWRALKAHAVVHIEHLKGALNVKADQLSRLFERRLSPDCEPSLALLLDARTDRALKDDDRSLIELIDSQCNTEPVPATVADCDRPASALNPDFDPLAFCDPANKFHRTLDVSFVLHMTDETTASPPSTTTDNMFAVNENLNPLNTIDAIFATDISQAAIPREPIPLAECASALCYDMDNLRFYMNLFQALFQSWRSLTRKERGREEIEPTQQKFEVLVARSAQTVMDRKTLPTALRGDLGPMIEVDGVCFYRIPCPDGTYRAIPFIPAVCNCLQRLYVKDCHRECAHMGVDYTQARLTDFACHRVRSVVTAVVKNCLFCQRKAATRHFKGPFEMVHDREGHLPYESIAVDHFALGDKTYALSIMCLSTGHISLSYCGNLTADAALQALRRIIIRYCTKPKFILADSAANLKACVAKLGYGVEFSQTTAHSQFENGKLERMHAVVSSVLTYKTHYDKINVPAVAADDPFAVQDLLDYASSQLNQRPLGYFAVDPRAGDNRVCLTPHSILFGNTCVLLETHPTGLDAWLKAHFDIVWRQLKIKSDLAIRGEPHSFYVGECVLVYKPSPKFHLCWTVGHVVDIVNNRVRVVDANGRETLQNYFNVCPLKPAQPMLPFHVTRVGALIEYDLDGKKYLGKIIDENTSGLVLIEWDPLDGATWPREWLSPRSIRIVSV